MLAPINSIKHYVQHTRVTNNSGAILINDIAKGVVAPAVSTTFDVIQGAIVKAIYVERWVMASQATTDPITYVYVIMKLPNDVIAPTAAQLNNLMAYTNKSNILFTAMAIVGEAATNNAVPIHRGWIMIPKGKQRMALGDRIITAITSLDNLSVCGFETYKEYR